MRKRPRPKPKPKRAKPARYVLTAYDRSNGGAVASQQYATDLDALLRAANVMLRAGCDVSLRREGRP